VFSRTLGGIAIHLGHRVTRTHGCPAWCPGEHLGGAIGVSVAHELGIRGDVAGRELVIGRLGLDKHEWIVINHEGLHIRKTGRHPLLISSK